MQLKLAQLILQIIALMLARQEAQVTKETLGSCAVGP